MDNSAAANQNSLFNSFIPAENLGRRRTEQLMSASQSPVMSMQDNARRNSNFNPSQSSNTSTQSVAGSTPQMPTSEISFSLLQALLKPQAPTQTQSSTQSPMNVSDLEKSFGNSPASLSMAAAAAAAVPLPPPPPPHVGPADTQEASRQANPIDQLRRMMAAQNINSSASASGSSSSSNQRPLLLSTATPSQQRRLTCRLPDWDRQQRQQQRQCLTNAKNGSDARDGNSAQQRKCKASYLNIDAKKIKLKGKPETVPISLLQQPVRYRPGRLVSVSRDYICYAVRSKEGGRIRVIHQLHGQRAKMQGHTDSIIDMAFHPCSREPGMPQILASLGKDNRLIIWLVGPVDMNAVSAESAIAYEPFVSVDSSGDARFTSLAWRSQVVDGMMELCVGTDKGFMVVRAPIPAQHDARTEISNEGLNIVPISTDSAVTAIERIGLNWIVTATADSVVRIYELESGWTTNNVPCKLLCEVGRCEQTIDTLLYIPPASAADGAGHLIAGYSQNKNMQLWWLGNSPDQIALLQYISYVGIPPKLSAAFSKIAWTEQGRYLVLASSHTPAAIYVLRTYSNGPDMRLSYPHGYSLGEDQPTLSLVATVEPVAGGASSEPILSIYSVHSRLVQQLQITGVRASERQALPDPATIYASNPRATPLAAPPMSSSNGAPAASDLEMTSAAGFQRLASQQHQHQHQHQQDTASSSRSASILPKSTQVNPSAAAAELQAALTTSLSAEIKSQISAAFASLQANTSARQSSLTLSAQAESELVERISSQIENRVVGRMASIMEQTLIPAYDRATVAMFEQMQSTFEAGLREWWMRFAQMMPPPPIATPLSHMAMMPQAQAMPQAMNAMSNDTQQQQRQQQSGSHALQAAHTSMNMPMPHASSAATSPITTAAGPSHLEAIMSLLNMQPPPGSIPPQQQQQQFSMDAAIPANAQRMHPQANNNNASSYR
ncbi:hypothetical protein GGI07_004870 [Coemansia sp. Benny D115]|nr:hypothetical protein GGI07_004870 [Coemansia sp. Benny D115]